MNFKIPFIICLILILFGLSLMIVFGLAIAHNYGLRFNIYDLEYFFYRLDRVFDDVINQALYYGQEIYNSLNY